MHVSLIGSITCFPPLRREGREGHLDTGEWIIVLHEDATPSARWTPSECCSLTGYARPLAAFRQISIVAGLEEYLVQGSILIIAGDY